MVGSRDRPMLHQHKTCGKVFDPAVICSECGEPVVAKAVHVHLGLGARKSSPVHAKKRNSERKAAALRRRIHGEDDATAVFWSICSYNRYLGCFVKVILSIS